MTTRWCMGSRRAGREIVAMQEDDETFGAAAFRIRLWKIDAIPAALECLARYGRADRVVVDRREQVEQLDRREMEVSRLGPEKFGWGGHGDEMGDAAKPRYGFSCHFDMVHR